MPYDQMRATPQNATLGAIARALQGAHEFAARPFGYDNPPGAFLSEMLGVPATARTVERLSYGQPITNIGKANVPLLPDDTADAAMTVVPMAGPLARAAGKGAKAGAKVVGQELNRAILDNSGSLAALVPQAAKPLYAVKPKGGNWLAGSVENAVQPLRSKPEWLSGEMINEAAGDNLWARMVEEGGHHDPHGWLQKNRPDIYNQFIGPEGAAVNRWLDTKLSKYMRNEMGTPEDPVRALAERGIVHQEQSPLNTYNLDAIEEARTKGGFPAEGLAKTRAGREWEAATDYAILPDEAGVYNREPHLQENPWLAKIAPETPVYGVDRLSPNNMFGHLVDELKFSLDPTSDLPQHLRFDLKDIDKITVPQAVERVSQINAWRAEQAAKAERTGMLENLKAEPRLPDESLQLSFVDKPGGAWVDIPDTVNDKGMPICNSIGKAGGWCTQNEWAATSYGSGPNRLTALVDAEGRPHAQAKITNDLDEEGAFESVINGMTPEQEAAYMQWAEGSDAPPELGDALEWMRDNEPSLYKDYKDTLRSQVNGPPDITELKPVGNSFDSERAREYMKRDPEYKQKVTESVLKFLNSGEWGKVKDLQHYDIVDMQDPNSVFRGLNKTGQSNREIAAYFNDLLDNEPDLPRFMTKKQLTDLVKDLKGSLQEGLDDAPGYGKGGLVEGAVKGLGEMVERYLVKEAPKEQKMLMGVYRGYAGEAPGETVYHAGAAFTEPRPGLFTTPERAAAEQFQRATGAPQLHTLEAKPRRVGTEEDVYSMARRLGIYNPGVPAGQYLEQGENAIFPEAGRMVEELRGQGLDSLRLKDGMGKQPSLVALDPAVVRPAPELFATPQRRVADYYAQKRAEQTGERPHMEMLLVDPFAGRSYGHSTMGTGKQEPMTTRARKLRPEDVQGRTQMYAQGGFVDGGPTDQDGVNSMVDEEKAMGGPVGYAAGGLVNYDPNEIDTIVSRLKEEIYA